MFPGESSLDNTLQHQHLCSCRWEMKLPAVNCRVTSGIAPKPIRFRSTSYGAVASPFIPAASCRVFWRRRIKLPAARRAGPPGSGGKAQRRINPRFTYTNCVVFRQRRTNKLVNTPSLDIDKTAPMFYSEHGSLSKEFYIFKQEEYLWL